MNKTTLKLSDFNKIINEVSVIYGFSSERGEIEAPLGYEFTGEFRLPRVGEIALASPSLNPWKIGDWDKINESRLILKPLVLKEHVFKETGEFRPALHDEYYLWNNEIYCSGGGMTTCAKIVVRSER